MLNILWGRQALFGFRDDLGLNTGNRFSISAAIFYLGYLVTHTLNPNLESLRVVANRPERSARIR